MQAGRQLLTTVVELVATTLIAILMDRWVSTRAAVFALCLCLVVVGWLHWAELEPLYRGALNWGRENTVLGVSICGLLGLALGASFGHLALRTPAIPASNAVRQSRPSPGRSPGQITPSPNLTPPLRTPHVRMVLFLDSVTESNVFFHVGPEVVNATIENIRVTFKSHGATGQEVQPPFHRTLSPGDKMSISGPPFFLKPHAWNRLDVTLTYDTEDKRSFDSSFVFFFHADNPGAIAPEGSQSGESGPQDEATVRLLTALQLPTATIYLELNEVRPDGRPNVATVGNAVRNFSFDPLSALATFRAKLRNGSSIVLQGHLQKRSNRMHELTLEWDENTGRASLRVDEVPARKIGVVE